MPAGSRRRIDFAKLMKVKRIEMALLLGMTVDPSEWTEADIELLNHAARIAKDQGKAAAWMWAQNRLNPPGEG